MSLCPPPQPRHASCFQNCSISECNEGRDGIPLSSLARPTPSAVPMTGVSPHCVGTKPLYSCCSPLSLSLIYNHWTHVTDAQCLGYKCIEDSMENMPNRLQFFKIQPCQAPKYSTEKEPGNVPLWQIAQAQENRNSQSFILARLYEIWPRSSLDVPGQEDYCLWCKYSIWNGL